MRESAIEKAVVASAKAAGWIALKLNGPGDKGKPDRLFLKDGRAVFVEFKAPDKRPTALQEQFLERLRAAGFSAVVVDDADAGRVMLGATGAQK